MLGNGMDMGSVCHQPTPDLTNHPELVQLFWLFMCAMSTSEIESPNTGEQFLQLLNLSVLNAYWIMKNLNYI